MLGSAVKAASNDVGANPPGAPVNGDDAVAPALSGYASAWRSGGTALLRMCSG